MPGKEFKSRGRTVQKMSRDGLIEENLRTGQSRRLVQDKDGVRIGDRPMDMYDENPEDTDRRIPSPDRGSRPGRLARSPSLPEQPAGAGRSLSYFREPGQDMEDTGNEAGGSTGKSTKNRSRRTTEKKGLSGREAPSSYQLDSRESRTEAGVPGMDLASRKSGIDTGEAGETERRQRRKKMAAAQFRAESGTGPDSSLNGEETKESPLHFSPAASREEDSREEPAGETDSAGRERDVRQQSRLLQQARGHPSPYLPDRDAAHYAGALVHEKDDAHAVSLQDEQQGHRHRLREDSSGTDGLDALKGEIQAKQKKERLNHEQRKNRADTRLSFDDEGGMVRGSGAGFSRKPLPPAAGALSGAAKGALTAAGIAADQKLSEAEADEDNAGLDAAHGMRTAAQGSVRAMSSRRSKSSDRREKASRRMGEESQSVRLQFGAEEAAEFGTAPPAGMPGSRKDAKTQAAQKEAARKFLRKQRQRRMIAAAKKEEKTVEAVFKNQQNFMAKAASVVREAVVKNSGVLIILGTMLVLFLMVSTSLASCTALIQGAGHSFISTTYPSTDEDIYAVENRYRELEAGLDSQIRRMQETHPTYDEFRFQIDEITHNPYHLISYFTTKYGQFTYEQVKDELEEIFREQYTLTTSGERGVTITETRTVRPGESLGQVTTSGYCPCEICCGSYAGGTTASGVYPLAGYTIAVDAYDPFVPMGTHVIMNGIEYVVEDTGSFGRFGVQFDVYYDDHESAVAHGHQVCEAFLAEGGGIEELELTTTRTVDRMSVVLTNNDLDTVLQNRLTDEEKVRYSMYNLTFGNRDYLFDLNSLPKYGNASRDYSIPPEALSDERFARMIAEAEKHLGTPYVWGGYAPGGFDCSGFVCWVVNHCGNGWDIGRTTAEGIRQICAYVSPEDARPGDIIFFENTYECAGASHVGIYVGDGMMIHCGEPVQYTSINTSYWQDHFMEFGRLP